MWSRISWCDRRALRSRDRVGDRGVLVGVLLQQAGVRDERHGGEPARDRAVEEADRLAQLLVLRRALDDVVKVVVRLDPAARQPRGVGAAVAPRGARDVRDQAVEALPDARELTQLAVLDHLGGEPRRQALELRAHLVRLADVAGRGAPDERAAPRDERDQPFGLELAQRLADRRPADPEVRGERLLPEPQAHRVAARRDRPPDRARDLVDELAASRGALGSRHSRGPLTSLGSNF